MTLHALISAAAHELDKAGERGLTEMELAAAIDTRWPGRVLGTMQREGYDLHQQDGRWILEGAPGVGGARGVVSGSPFPSDAPVSSSTLSTGLGVGRDIDTAASSPAEIPSGEAVGKGAGPRVDISPSSETLFDPPAPGHYSADVAA